MRGVLLLLLLLLPTPTLWEMWMEDPKSSRFASVGCCGEDPRLMLLISSVVSSVSFGLLVLLLLLLLLFLFLLTLAFIFIFIFIPL